MPIFQAHNLGCKGSKKKWNMQIKSKILFLGVHDK